MNEIQHTDNVQLPETERPSPPVLDARSEMPTGKRLVDECHELVDRLDSDQLETIRALMEIFLRPGRA